jgi:hypothetical protein
MFDSFGWRGALEHFPEKHALAKAGWSPVFRQKMRPLKED